MSPAESVQVLEHYGIVLLPIFVVAEQFGIPLPAVPLLLGFGALAASGRGNIPLTLCTLTLVALAVDFAWYELGRRRGARVLSRLCRLSLDPDFCVARAESVFRRFGARTMLVAKFVPGLTTILPPLAGMVGVGRVRFALYELGGVLLWAGMWMGLGYAFSDAVARITARVAALGLDIALVLGVGLAGYILIMYLRRLLSFRRLRNVPLSPEELKRRLDAGEDITIIDVRTALEMAAMPYAIPGSHWIAADEIHEYQSKVLRAGELLVYCS
jgi:membrane protein DedA with SNARE-associated domain